MYIIQIVKILYTSGYAFLTSLLILNLRTTLRLYYTYTIDRKIFALKIYSPIAEVAKIKRGKTFQSEALYTYIYVKKKLGGNFPINGK